MTDEELNKFITEKVFGECYHEFGEWWSLSQKCLKCGFVCEVTKQNQGKDYCSNYNAIAEARNKIAEKGLSFQFGFMKALENIVVADLNVRLSIHDSFDGVDLFDLVNALPRQQSEAIYEVLKDESY